jgi:hypothetical protein
MPMLVRLVKTRQGAEKQAYQPGVPNEDVLAST